MGEPSGGAPGSAKASPLPTPTGKGTGGLSHPYSPRQTETWPPALRPRQRALSSVPQLSKADCGQQFLLSCPLPLELRWQCPKAGIRTHSNLPFGS